MTKTHKCKEMPKDVDVKIYQVESLYSKRFVWIMRHTDIVFKFILIVQFCPFCGKHLEGK